MALGYATTLRNNRLDEITAYAGTSAKILIYDGTRPATGGSATTLLAQLTGDGTAFAGAASSGALTLEAVTSDTSANATGTATWFRITASDDTFVMDGDVDDAGGTNGNDGDLILSTVSIEAGDVVSISSAVITEGNA